VLPVYAQMNLRLREFIEYASADVIAPTSAVEFEGMELGAAGSVPLSVMNAVVAAKSVQGLAGVMDFEEVIASGGLLYDPSPNADMAAPDLMIARDEDGNGVAADSVLGSTVELRMALGERMISVRPGPQGYVESGGRENLATASGPGAQSVGEAPYVDGEALGIFSMSVTPGNNRTPTSGDSALAGMTSWDFAFDPADEVAMAGIVYLSRGNFQHSNSDGIVTLWGQAVYSDGSTSALLSSDKLDAPSFGSEGGELWDHFFGFEAPEGLSIRYLRVWNRGGNNRSFTDVDDLVVVLRGEESYDVTVDVNDATRGTAAGAGSYIDGTTATLEATVNEGFAFAGWSYALEPTVLASSDANAIVTVNGPVAYQANFIVESIDPLEQAVDAAGGEFTVQVNGAANWSVESPHPWIVVTQVERVLGGGVVHYTVNRNFSQEARSGSLLIAGFTHTVNQAAGAAADTLSDRIAVTQVADDWYASDWLGVFAEGGNGYIFHLGLGWLNTELAVDDDAMYLWSEELQLWLYTSQSLYPYMYAFDETPQWIFLRVIQEQLVKFGYDAESGWTQIMVP
jgi:hypothetical protein